MRAILCSGFAKAIIRECFQRMTANGIKIAYIASPAEPDIANYLYDALSPMSRREVHRYVESGQKKGQCNYHCGLDQLAENQLTL